MWLVLFVAQGWMGAGLLSADAAAPTNTGDSEEFAYVLDRVAVTGTRLRRIDLEGPLPISVIERDEIEAAGHSTLSDLLRELPFNAFGTVLEEPNRTNPGQRLLNLRGLGPAYTLVLLDGQRLPGYARSFGASTTSISGLPLAAIDRVEILRDGASAVYGSEAIGGVVNLVTRRGAQPLTLGYQHDHPSAGGGRIRSAELLAGGDIANGDWLLALHLSKREPLLATQRPYLLENAPLSPSGAPGSFRRIDPDTGAPVGPFEPDSRCPERPGESAQFPSSGRLSFPVGVFCGYRFRDSAFERTGLDSVAGYASLRQQLGDHVQLESRLMIWRNEGESQLAPSPGLNFILPADSPFNPTRGELGPDLGFPLLVLFRLTPLGPRVAEARDDNLHLASRLMGAHVRGNWQLGWHHNAQNARELGPRGFALVDRYQQILAAGRFDPFSARAGEAGVLAEAAYVPLDRGRSRSSGVDANFSIDTGVLRHGVVELVAGATLRRDRYSADPDHESLRGNIVGSGSPAFAGSASRGHGAAFVEALLALGEGIEANLALRYDRYQDSGNALSPRLALGWRLGQTLLVRGAAGRGFRVVDLESGYASSGRSVGFVRDVARCPGARENPQSCAVVLTELEGLPNPMLDPERAHQEALGLVWQPLSDTSLGVDLYRVRVRDQVARLNPVEVMFNELGCLEQGRACDARREGQVVRDTLGNVELVLVPLVNIAAFRSRGLDVEATQAFDLGNGRLRLALRATRVLQFERQLRPGDAGADVLGLFGQPRHRSTLTADLVLGRHGLHAGARHVGGFRSCFSRHLPSGEPNQQCERARVRSHAEFDLRWAVALDWNGSLALGVRNLANRRAPLDAVGELAYGLHDILGRTPYLRYEQRF
jgi:iron complex outermembrane recepter protein